MANEESSEGEPASAPGANDVAAAEEGVAAAPGDPLASTREGAGSEEFVSRRGDLGQPRSVVPAASPELAERPVAPAGRAGAWYKLAAGLVFLLSLGYIGYRQKQSRRLPTTDWEAFEQPLSRWTPPADLGSSRAVVSAPAGTGTRRSDGGRPREGDGRTAAPGRENELLVRDAGKPRRGGASKFDVYDEEPSGDAGFHPEIEKRVRRKQMDALGSYAPSRLARGAGYAAIEELAARGYAADEIARHLGITTAEVRTYMQIEQMPMLD